MRPASPPAGDYPHSLAGKLLVAMPGMPDQRFARAVIFVCAHSSEGAMGLVINRVVEDIDFDALLPQLGIPESAVRRPLVVQFGGPVEPSRGFVLHSADVLKDDSMRLDGNLALTATLDILRAIALGEGPQRHLFALGYAGWGPGQLDQEIQANGWLHVEADERLLFDVGLESRWAAALDKLGIDLVRLSGEAGHA